MTHLDVRKEYPLADQTPKPEDKESDDLSRERENREVDRPPRAPNPTDLEFFNDPVIYEQDDVISAAEETHHKHDAERGSRPLGNRRQDQDIKQEIDRLLAWQKTIDATDVHVEVKEGVVTLSGNVGSPYEKDVAENITKNVLGIQHVNNLLNIHRPDTPSQK